MTHWLVGTALAFAFAIAQNNPQGTLTLEDALRIAEQNAFSLRIAEREVEEAKAQERLARARLGIGAQLTGTTTASDTDIQGGFGGGRNTSTNIQLQVAQIIDIAGIEKARIEGASFNRQSLQAQSVAVRNDLRNEVKTAFFTALQAQEILNIQQETLAANQARLQDAEKRQQAGAVPRFDVLRLQTIVKQSEQEVTRANGNLTLAKQQLNLTLGQPIETPLDLQARPEAQTPEIQPDALVQTALATRPELERARLGIEALASLRKADERAGRPQLTLGALYSRAIDPAPFSPRENRALSASVNIPLVTGGLIEANAKAARERENRAKILLEQLTLAITLEVRAAATQLQTALAEFETANANVALATEALRLAQLRYDEQVGILLDVTTAQADLTSAKSAEVAAAYRVRNALANLQRAVGDDTLPLAPTQTELVPAPDPINTKPRTAAFSQPTQTQ